MERSQDESPTQEQVADSGTQPKRFPALGSTNTGAKRAQRLGSQFGFNV
jgi:hypothetical protein